MLLSRTAIGTFAGQMLLLALAGMSLPSAAQLRADGIAEPALLAPRRAAAMSAPLLPTASTAHTYSGVPASSSSWLGNAIQLEGPRATADGQYVRPKFHVGVPSESMRGFLNSAGFPADKCQLPMVRARTRTSGDGDLNGTLWLFARCTFY
ncbi:MAG: hypothetical protein ABJA83_06720 [Burkholderiaceae bacterium]